MRIRNSYFPSHTTLSSLSPKRLHYSDDQITFDCSPESPPVMISRVNGRTFNKQELGQGIGHEEGDEEEEEEEEEEMNFAPANQSSLIGGWREEEKAMPFKKRRMINFEEEKSSDNMDRGKMVKGEDDLIRCGRTDGRRWRCSGRRVQGYSMCEHHLLTRSARYRSDNLKTEIAEKGDHQKKKVVMEEEGCFGKCENEDGNNSSSNNNNKRKVVKARSINSLVRDGVPLMPLNL